MRLLLFTYEFPPRAGGISRYCYELVKEFCKLGQHVFVLTLRYSEGGMRLKEPFEVIRIPNIRSGKLNILAGCFYLIYSIFFRKPDHILVTHGIPELICSMLAFILPVKFSITIIGSDILYRSLTWLDT